jgi:hypothetical protein
MFHIISFQVQIVENIYIYAQKPNVGEPRPVLQAESGAASFFLSGTGTETVRRQPQTYFIPVHTGAGKELGTEYWYRYLFL